MSHIRMFIGHDRSQAINTTVCSKSILRHWNRDTDAQLELITLPYAQSVGYNRKEDGSTEFTYTRFLVPWICGYTGTAIFCDSDFVWRDDPLKMLEEYKGEAVSVVKHDVDHVNSEKKMGGKASEWYPRKWWSSLMIFDCSHDDCKKLDPKSVSNASAKILHRFEWVSGKIGSLPTKYNHLVGYYDNPKEEPVGVHFTDGTPIHEMYKDVEYADEWEALRDNR